MKENKELVGIYKGKTEGMEGNYITMDVDGQTIKVRFFLPWTKKDGSPKKGVSPNEMEQGKTYKLMCSAYKGDGYKYWAYTANVIFRSDVPKDQAKLVPSTDVAELRNKIINVLTVLDNGNGVSYEQILVNVESDETLVKKVVDKLIETGTVFQNIPGVFKLLYTGQSENEDVNKPTANSIEVFPFKNDTQAASSSDSGVIVKKYMTEITTYPNGKEYIKSFIIDRKVREMSKSQSQQKELDEVKLDEAVEE